MDKTIGVTGFIACGSSAVVEFLKEFDENVVFDKFEFYFTCYPDGIEDLAYHLCEGTQKTLSSYVSLERFRNFCGLFDKKISYASITSKSVFTKPAIFKNKDFKKLTDAYLNSIIQAQWEGKSFADKILHPSARHSRIYQRIIKHIPFLKREYQYSFSANPENFVENTKKYIDTILVQYMGRQKGKNFVLDQPFSPNNPEKSFPYFENPIAIVVDRDPRDLYLYEKFYRRPHKRKGLFPTDVEGFVSVYRNLRKNMPYLKNNDILNIRFEDMIYEYEGTAKKMVDFLDLKEHSNPKTIFRPDISASNTRLFDIFDDKENIHYIERQLPEYLYPYQNYEKLKNRGQIFGENPLYNNGR